MGTRVGQYLLFETIGRGAFGKVKLGVHADTGEQVAVKILEKNLIKQHDLTTQVRREIAIMKALKHKNIVNLHTVLTSKTKLYIVMDLVTGGELFQIISEKGEGGLDEKDARRYFQMLVDGIHYCHRRGVCHRDIKPENLLLAEDGELKLTDFGLSSIKGASTASDLLTTQCGTPSYVPPEIILHAAKGYSGQKVDAWACGIMLYAMLTGYLPFDGEDISELFMNIQSVKVEYPDWVPAGAVDLMEKLLNKDPSARWDLKHVKQHPWFVVDYTGDEFQRAQRKKELLEKKQREKQERERKEKEEEEARAAAEKAEAEAAARRAADEEAAARKDAEEQAIARKAAAEEEAARKAMEDELNAAKQPALASAGQGPDEDPSPAAGEGDHGGMSTSLSPEEARTAALEAAAMTEMEQHRIAAFQLSKAEPQRAAVDPKARKTSRQSQQASKSEGFSLAEAVASAEQKLETEEDDELSMAQAFPDREDSGEHNPAVASALVDISPIGTRVNSDRLTDDRIGRRGASQKTGGPVPKRISGISSRQSFRNISVASSFGQSFRAGGPRSRDLSMARVGDAGAAANAASGNRPALLGNSNLAQAAALGQSTSLLSSRIGFSTQGTTSAKSNEAAAASMAAASALGQSTSLLSSRIGFNMQRSSSRRLNELTPADIRGEVEAEESDEETEEEQRTLSEEQRVNLQSIRRLETLIAYAKHQSNSHQSSTRSMKTDGAGASNSSQRGERLGGSSLAGAGPGAPRRSLPAQQSMRMNLSMRRGSVMLQSSRGGFPGAAAALNPSGDTHGTNQAKASPPRSRINTSAPGSAAPRQFSVLMALWDEGFSSEKGGSLSSSEDAEQRKETLGAVKVVRERLERETHSQPDHPLVTPEEAVKLQSMLGIWAKKLELTDCSASEARSVEARKNGEQKAKQQLELTCESVSESEKLRAQESEVDDATLTTLQRVLRLWDESILGDAAPAEVELDTDGATSTAVSNGTDDLASSLDRDRADRQVSKPVRLGLASDRLQDSIYEATESASKTDSQGLVSTAAAASGAAGPNGTDLVDDDFELGLRKGYLNDAWKKALVPAQDSFAALGAIEDDSDESSDGDEFVDARGEKRAMTDVTSDFEVPDVLSGDLSIPLEERNAREGSHERKGAADGVTGGASRVGEPEVPIVDVDRERAISAAASAAAEAIPSGPAGSLPEPKWTLYGRLGYTPSVILDPARHGFGGAHATSQDADGASSTGAAAEEVQAQKKGSTEFEVTKATDGAGADQRRAAAERPRHVSDVKPQAFNVAAMLEEMVSAEPSPAGSQRSHSEAGTAAAMKDSTAGAGAAGSDTGRFDSQTSADGNSNQGTSAASGRNGSQRLGSKQKKPAAGASAGGPKRNMSSKVMALFSRATSRGANTTTRFVSQLEPEKCFVEMGRLITNMNGDVARKRDAFELKVRAPVQDKYVHAKIAVSVGNEPAGSTVVTFRKVAGQPYDAALFQAFFDDVRARFSNVADGAVAM